MSDFRSKVSESVRNGTFFIKVRNKIASAFRSGRCLFYVRDKRVKDEIYQRNVYNKLYRRYKNVIISGIEENTERINCNKVWICWLQGIDNAPELVKACVNSIKIMMPDWDIVVLTEETISQYVTFPDRILKLRRKNLIGNAHFSDLLRTELIYKYGGLWVDATVLCTGMTQEFDLIKTLPLFVYKDMNLSPNSDKPIVASNWLIAGQSHSQILGLTLKLLYNYWNDYTYAMDYYIFHIFFAMASRRYPEEWAAIPVFNNCSPHTMQFELETPYTEERWRQYLKISSFHKLNRYIDTVGIDTVYARILEIYR